MKTILIIAILLIVVHELITHLINDYESKSRRKGKYLTKPEHKEIYYINRNW